MNDSIVEMHDTKDLVMNEDEFGNYIITFKEKVSFSPGETIKIWKMSDSTTQQSEDGKHWEQAQQVPYYPSLRERLLCWLGFHENYPSKKYSNTQVCFRCGKRSV